MNNFEKVCEDTSNLRSPVEDSEGNLYLVTENGAVKRVREGQLLVTNQIFQICEYFRVETFSN